MDENLKIRFAWGGCGNLINNIIWSNNYYGLIVDYYTHINDQRTWTDQEWPIKGQNNPTPRIVVGKNLIHEALPSKISLAWENSLDTSLHYIVKNPSINHLAGSIEERVRGVIHYNENVENQIRQEPYWSLPLLLQDFDQLYNKCCEVNSGINKDQVKIIFELWREKTRLHYKKHCKEVLLQFDSLGLDYQPTTIYNILYENTNTR